MNGPPEGCSKFIDQSAEFDDSLLIADKTTANEGRMGGRRVAITYTDYTV